MTPPKRYFLTSRTHVIKLRGKGRRSREYPFPEYVQSIADLWFGMTEVGEMFLREDGRQNSAGAASRLSTFS